MSMKIFLKRWNCYYIIVIIFCSATEGADSRPGSGGATPSGEEGQIGQGKAEENKSTCHECSFQILAIQKDAF